MQLSILGPVLLDGSAPRGAKERALLARLLVAPGAAVPADTLIEAAWTPDRQDGVTRSLHVRIAKLRALLGCDRDALVRDAAGYRLAVSPDSVDAHRFAVLAEEAAGRPPADALAVCEQALALWRGEPFADLELLDDAATVEARRLHAIRDRLRRTRASALIALGRAQEAAQALAALVAEDPLREEPARSPPAWSTSARSTTARLRSPRPRQPPGARTRPPTSARGHWRRPPSARSASATPSCSTRRRSPPHGPATWIARPCSPARR